MKKIECPSCAMEIAEHSTQCPICGYEFAQARSSGWVKWIAVLLLLIILLYWIF